MFILVRHAHAGDKRSWSRPDTERPLSSSGRQQAAALTRTLTGWPVQQLLASPYLRCRQTLLPLAAATGLPVRDCELLVPAADPVALDEFVTDPAHDGSLFCTHGETLNALFSRWRQLGYLIDTPSTPKGAAWIVTTSDNKPHLQFAPPLLPSQSIAAL